MFPARPGSLDRKDTLCPWELRSDFPGNRGSVAMVLPPVCSVLMGWKRKTLGPVFLPPGGTWCFWVMTTHSSSPKSHGSGSLPGDPLLSCLAQCMTFGQRVPVLLTRQVLGRRRLRAGGSSLAFWLLGSDTVNFHSAWTVPSRARSGNRLWITSMPTARRYGACSWVRGYWVKGCCVLGVDSQTVIPESPFLCVCPPSVWLICSSVYLVFRCGRTEPPSA